MVGYIQQKWMETEIVCDDINFRLGKHAKLNA